MEKELILLGLLKEGPRHGYELKRVIDEKISTFAPVSAGSIYYTLKGLAKDGLVSMTKKRRDKYPEKEVYRITKKGEEKFRELLKKTCFNIKRLYRSLDIVLYFMNYLKPEEVIRGLRNRVGQVKRIKEETKGIYTKIKREKYPYYIQAIAQRNIRFMDEEIEWMEDFIIQVRKLGRKPSNK
jgi:DNA-binding PadR family transcriptional regulator